MIYKILFVLIIIILLSILYYLITQVEGFSSPSVKENPTLFTTTTTQEETTTTQEETTTTQEETTTTQEETTTTQEETTTTQEETTTTQEETTTTQEETTTTQEETTTTQEETTTTQEETTTTQEETTTTQEETTTTQGTLNAYNNVINKLDQLLTADKNSEIPTELKIDILELTETQQASLCDDYCEIYSGCTPLCNFLGCENCMETTPTNNSVYRQPDELDQNQVPQTQGNTHIGEPNPMNISHSGNGESNIFAPYVVVHKKKPGERYNAYVMSNPHDPNYYNYINNLS
jgi:hypothetical protein